eukprot:scaffold403813_cov59-Attheya_sp.AAC.1
MCRRKETKGAHNERRKEASSPTVVIESLMLTCVIDSKEERDVAVVDIPGAFMQVDMDELVHMKLEGKWPKSWSGSIQNTSNTSCRAQECTIWDTKGRTFILAMNYGAIEGVGFQN